MNIIDFATRTTVQDHHDLPRADTLLNLTGMRAYRMGYIEGAAAATAALGASHRLRGWFKTLADWRQRGMRSLEPLFDSPPAPKASCSSAPTSPEAA